MDKQPNTIKTMAMTQAKTGRSRKNLDNICESPSASVVAIGRLCR